jgi:hypothetical protein
MKSAPAICVVLCATTSGPSCSVSARPIAAPGVCGYTPRGPPRERRRVTRPSCHCCQHQALRSAQADGQPNLKVPFAILRWLRLDDECAARSVITGRVSINFPEPEAIPAASNIYVHVWVGSGNVDPDLGTYLLNVDPRFSRLSEPKAPGLRPGTSQVPEIPVFPDLSLLSFRLQVPFDVEPSVCSMCLMRRSPFLVGEVLGRA